MATLIKWSDRLSVSFDQIDNEHKKLIDIINELNDGMAAGKSNDVLGKVLDNLIQYTAFHFKNEETMMQKYGYPDYDKHKAEHDELVKTAVELQTTFRAGTSRIGVQVMSFLKDWLQTHIKGTDMQLGAFLSQKQAA